MMGQISCKAQLENPNPSLYSDELWEEAKGQCSFFRSQVAVILARYTFVLSTISSFLIIYLILKSPTRLSSIYHRIMFGTSICQMIASIPRSLTTLPMPAPGDYWTDIVNMPGVRLGNTFTCTVQGFLVRFGDVSADSYFQMGLTFYYTCAIGFEMKIENLTKYIEPLIHGFCILWAVKSSLTALFVGGYNVSFDEPSCTVASKPWFCNSQNSTVPCVRGGVGIGDELETDKVEPREADPPLIVFVLVCLLIICCRVYKKDRKTATMIRNLDVQYGGRRDVSNSRGQEASPVKTIRIRPDVYRILTNGEEITLKEIQQQSEDRYKDTKVIVMQAALYFAFQVFVLACEIFYSFSTDNMLYASTVDVIFWSMQSFYLLLIFIFHSVFNQRRHNSNMSISEAIIETFKGGSGSDTFIMSGISQVRTINKEMESNAPSIVDFEDNESVSLVSSCGMTVNFGSISLPTEGRSLLFASSWGTNDNHDTESNCEKPPLDASDEYPGGRLYRLSEGDCSSRLSSGFTKDEPATLGNFGSISLPTEGQSFLVASSWGTNSNTNDIQSNLTKPPLDASDKYSSMKLSGFTRELGEGNEQESLEELQEEGMSDNNSSISSWNAN